MVAIMVAFSKRVTTHSSIALVVAIRSAIQTILRQKNDLVPGLRQLLPFPAHSRKLADLVRPDLETDQRVGAEGMGDRHVSRIAPLSNQHAADSRHVVARVECVPPPAKIGLEPAGDPSWPSAARKPARADD